MSSLVNVGFNNMVSVQRIIAIVAPDSAPSKRTISKAKELDKLVDATHGRRTRSLIICDNGHIILSSLQPQTISDRINRDNELLTAGE